MVSITPSASGLRSGRLTVKSPPPENNADRGSAMVARITRYRIRPGKMEEFAATVEAVTARLDKLEGFRVLVILRGEDPSGREATAISVWDSVDHMKSSESDKFYYDAIKRLIGYCESFSPMHQHEVLKIKLAKM
jgi:heme-degrading monooxygenase HmoA